jgi:hypothetical protein
MEGEVFNGLSCDMRGSIPEKHIFIVQGKVKHILKDTDRNTIPDQQTNFLFYSSWIMPIEILPANDAIWILIL